MDKFLKGQIIVDGLRAQLKGRIKGRMRARKAVKTTGNLFLQNRMSRVFYKSSVLLTKYGSLGIKVHGSVIKKQKPRYFFLCEPVSPVFARLNARSKSYVKRSRLVLKHGRKTRS